LYSESKDVVSDVDRQAAINVVKERTGKSQEESAKIVDGWIQKFQQAQAEAEQAGAEIKQEAAQAGEAVAQGTAKAAAWGLLALVLGAIAALLGGIVGTPKERPIPV
jgi:hypothetical protein